MLLRIRANGAELTLPYREGEALANPDSSVDAIDAGAWLADADIGSAFFLLLECRRVLRPSGRLHALVAPESSTGRLAVRAGFTIHGEHTGSSGFSGAQPTCFVKPERRIVGCPLVSVLIPAYNPRFFAEALASAVAQTYEPLEIVVCDDSESGDIEATVRQSIGMHDVRYLRNLLRLHGRGNYIRCLASARGDFVKFVNDDDVLEPSCVARLLSAFRDVPDLTLATSRRRRIDERSATLPDQPATRPIVAGDAVIAGWTAGNAMLMAGLNFIGEPSTTLFRKSDIASEEADPFCFDGVRGFGVIDMATWATLSLKGNVVYLGESLSSFRIHAQQRQAAPEIRQRSIDSIRELQAAWLALGLHTRIPSDGLLVRPMPPRPDAPWNLTQLLTFATSLPLVEWSASFTISPGRRR